MKLQGIEERASGAAAAIELVQGEPSSRVMLFPMGRVVPKDGREPWILRDRAHAEEVVAATRSRLNTLDLMIDYDHQAVTAPAVGGQAKAAGWVKPDTLEATDDGIFGTVEWTDAAKAALSAREYRYLSPHFGFTKDGRELTRLFNAALVNIPALEMAAVAAQQPEEQSMKKIATALGLSADATEDAIVAAIEPLKAGSSLTAIASALKLNDDASAEDIATAAAAAAARPEPVDLAPIVNALGLDGEQTVEQLATAAAQAKAGSFDPTKFVPIETHQALQAKLGQTDEESATAAVDAAIAAGKIVPANRDWALGYAKKDRAAFDNFVANTVEILKPGEGEAAAAAKKGDDKLTDEEAAIAANLGLTPEQYLKTKKEDA